MQPASNALTAAGDGGLRSAGARSEESVAAEGSPHAAPNAANASASKAGGGSLMRFNPSLESSTRYPRQRFLMRKTNTGFAIIFIQRENKCMPQPTVRACNTFPGQFFAGLHFRNLHIRSAHFCEAELYDSIDGVTA